MRTLFLVTMILMVVGTAFAQKAKENIKRVEFKSEGLVLVGICPLILTKIKNMKQLSLPVRGRR
jgi:uncharacterized membrane protein